MVHACWWYYFSKFTEFLDTVSSKKFSVSENALVINFIFIQVTFHNLIVSCGDQFSRWWCCVNRVKWNVLLTFFPSQFIFLAHISPHSLSGRHLVDFPTTLTDLNLKHVHIISFLHFTKVTQLIQLVDIHSPPHVLIRIIFFNFDVSQIFFVLRKKTSQVSTLHVIHHGVMPMSGKSTHTLYSLKYTFKPHSSCKVHLYPLFHHYSWLTWIIGLRSRLVIILWICRRSADEDLLCSGSMTVELQFFFARGGLQFIHNFTPRLNFAR